MTETNGKGVDITTVFRIRCFHLNYCFSDIVVFFLIIVCVVIYSHTV